MLLFTHFILFVRVAPLTGRVADGLLAPARMRAIQEELAAFFLDHVIPEDGEFYVDPEFV